MYNLLMNQAFTSIWTRCNINYVDLLLTGKQSIPVYKKWVGEIEFIHKFIFFTFCVAIFTCVCAPAPYSLAQYYFSDMGEDSFFLGWSSWFVFIIEWNALIQLNLILSYEAPWNLDVLHFWFLSTAYAALRQIE